MTAGSMLRAERDLLELPWRWRLAAVGLLGLNVLVVVPSIRVLRRLESWAGTL